MRQSHQRRNAILQMQGEVAVRADAGASPQPVVGRMLLPNMLVSNFGKLNILGVRVKCKQATRPEIKKFNMRRQRWHLAIPSTTQSSGGESGGQSWRWCIAANGRCWGQS